MSVDNSYIISLSFLYWYSYTMGRLPKYRSMCVGIVLGQKGTAPSCCEQSRAVVCCQASSITSGSGTSIPFLKPCFTAFFVCWAAAAP